MKKQAIYPKFELAVSTDKLRQNMQSIYIDGNAGHIVATNGHILVAMPINRMPYVIPSDCYNKGITADGWKAIWHTNTISVKFEPNLFTVVDNKGNTRIFPLLTVDNFPEWKRFFTNADTMPDIVGYDAQSFNGHYMAILQDCLATWAVTFINSTDRHNNPYYVVPNSPDDCGAFGIIMPVMIDAGHMRAKLDRKLAILNKEINSLINKES